MRPADVQPRRVQVREQLRLLQRVLQSQHVSLRHADVHAPGRDVRLQSRLLRQSMRSAQQILRIHELHPQRESLGDDSACCSNFCDPATMLCDFPQCKPDGQKCAQSFECCTGFCDPNQGTCGFQQCTPDGFGCMQGSNAAPASATRHMRHESMQARRLRLHEAVRVLQRRLPEPGLRQPECLPKGSNCNGAQCCVGLACQSGLCGTPLKDSGTCNLDPGGTPCSQCVVGMCCDQIATCLNDPQCSQSQGCFQRCAIGNTPPAQCEQQCCTSGDCPNGRSA